MKRSKHSLSNYKLLTMDMGKLYPINCMEVLPGDTIQQATSALIRVSPLLAPVMHPVRIRIHHWYVPLSIIWDNFEKFITGTEVQSAPVVHPYINMTVAEGSLADYLGLPVIGSAMNLSALPFRAYLKIWQEYYRDQDLQSEMTVALGDGLDEDTQTDILSVCWEKDYFTSARPWTQKGDDVSVPFGGAIDIVGNGDFPVTMSNSADATNRDLVIDASNHLLLSGASVGGGAPYASFSATGTKTGLEADYSGLQLAINDLREAMALQKYAEARSKYGSRYSEYLRYLGVKSSDGRLKRPEYLGGGKQTIQFSEVVQTAGDSTGAQTGVGNLGGHGIGAMRTNRYRRFFEEHGIVMSLMSVLPKTIYGQGINKMWTRATKEDYYQRELENIGQAEVKNKEVYAAHSAPEGTFGYQDRYDEYRRQESMVHSEFRSTLDHWHMARIFAGDVTLNEDFVKANPTKRIHAEQNSQVLWVMANNSIQARRPVGGRR